MYTFPLGLMNNINTNNMQKLSFGTSFALTSNTFPKNEKGDIFNFSKRYEEIKKFNPDKMSTIKLLRLNDEEYAAVMDTIYKFPKREKALLDKSSKLNFSKTKDTFNGITNKRLGLTFSNGYGFHSIVNTSNDWGDLHVLRECSSSKGRSAMKFVDKSRFNEKYFIENSYSKKMKHLNDFRTVETRNISVNDNKLHSVLDYSYSKTYFQNSNFVEFSVNGRKYNAKIGNDGKGTIRSGSKWGKFDFSKALRLLPESEREKEVFINALKMLPPQILLELDETLKPLLKNAEKRYELSLECFLGAIKQVPEENRESFVNALKTALPQMLSGLDYTLSNLTFNEEQDEKIYSDFSNLMHDVPANKRKIIIKTLKSLPQNTILELKDNISKLNNKRSRSLCLFSPSAAADSMINLTIERLVDKHSLTFDKELKEIFNSEKENFTEWLKENSEGHLIKLAQNYTKANLEPEEELMEIVKSVCNLLWMEEYDENKADDEGKRLLLNFFPETVSYIVSVFELNAASYGSAPYSSPSNTAA